MASKDFHIVAETGIPRTSALLCLFKQLANLLQISLLTTKGKAVNLKSIMGVMSPWCWSKVLT